ncbi:stathmin domain-containing protein 1 [Pempheris klunzingeri]|uniref:stathmin domain-containing protein 1 n=1 Tax=Pempheris klunzingeri TaxID=3127111 RepID=UPI00397F3F6C
MGCGNSTSTAVQQLRPEEVNGDEDEKGSKLDGRGDSAVSKGTADSGVVMESREIPVLPGTVPRELPPLPTQDGLLQQESTVQERPKSSDILEELLNQGIIPVGQSRERGGRGGEAYSIMLDDREGVSRRPPARLESLKAKKALNLLSRDEIEERIRLAEERRKLREDELKTRLRSKTARVRTRVPSSSPGDNGDAALTLVEPLQSPFTPDPLDPPPHSQVTRQAAEGGECEREAGGDGRECKEEMGRRERREEGGERRDNRGEGAERVNEDGDGEEEEELIQVEELNKDQLLTALEELENDYSFQRTDDKDEIF